MNDGEQTSNGHWAQVRSPEISVVISTYGRSSLLGPLFVAMGSQTLSGHRWELIVVDNGSTDDTWQVLQLLVGSSPFPACAVRLSTNRGPGGGRNAGVAMVRSSIVAFTDDDCLPTEGWLAGLLAVFDGSVDVVQGRVAADPVEEAVAGSWDHRVEVGGMTPWFETCNIAYRTQSFRAVGGFDEADSLTSQAGGGRAFGEDALLGARVVAAGGRRGFAEGALVHHRVVSNSYWGVFREWRYFSRFPGLVARSEVARASLRHGLFLNDQTQRFDLAVASVALAVLARRPTIAIGSLPWLRSRYRPALAAGGSLGGAATWLVKRGLLEGVGLASLARGSIRYRQIVL